MLPFFTGYTFESSAKELYNLGPRWHLYVCTNEPEIRTEKNFVRAKCFSVLISGYLSCTYSYGKHHYCSFA